MKLPRQLPRKLLYSALGLLVGQSHLAYGQEGTLEEITVTAQRRAENLQTVPVAVSAFSEKYLRDYDVHNLDGIAARVPSLTFSPFAPGQAIIALRGVSSNDDGAGTDNSVAVFLDDVYIGGLAAVAFDWYDLESVEVLRGPQGTLFGKNAIGGAINIRSLKPNTDKLSGRIEGSLGNYKQRDLRGYVTGPLGDSLAGKLAFSSRQNDGYVNNIVLNKKQKNEDVQSVRGQLLFHRDSFEALLSAEYTNEDVEDMGRIPVVDGSVPVTTLFANLGGNRDNVTNPIDGFSKRKAKQLSLRLSKEFNSGELLSITAWRDFDSNWHMDSVGVPFGPNLGVNDDITEDVKAVSQEFRFASQLDGAFNYVAGAYFLKEDTHRIERFHLTTGLGPQSEITDLGVDISDQDNETKSYAVFGQVSWDISDRAKLNVGARFTYEEKTLVNISTAGRTGIQIIGEDFSGTASADWNDFSPKISLDYKLADETMLYASISKGFKSGGFPAAPARAQDFQPIRPEEAISYEVGIKSDLVDNTLRLNATAYFMDYTDLQVQRFGVDAGAPPGSFGVFQTLNAGDAEVKGLELEATWVITERVQINGMYSYTDSKFVDTVLIDAQGNPLDISGQELTRAPKDKYTIGLEYNQPLPSGRLLFLIDHRYTGFNRQDIFADASNQPAFRLTDARLAWVNEADTLEISLWGKNITDEEYIAHSYIVGPGVIATFGPPRTYGVTAAFRFGG